MSVRSLLAVTLLALVLGASSLAGSSLPAQGATGDWVLAPGKAGPIGAGSTLATLQKAFGKANVRVTKIALGEGETEEGALLFPGDPQKRLELTWQDPKGRARPRFARVQGTKSLWHTAQGITLGTTLKQLEKLNGKPFRLLGMAWDYEGTIVNWNGGTLAGLEPAEDRRVVFRMGGEAAGGYEAIEPIIGDSEFSSDHPTFQAFNPAVREIVVFFPGSSAVGGD